MNKIVVILLVMVAVGGAAFWYMGKSVAKVGGASGQGAQPAGGAVADSVKPDSPRGRALAARQQAHTMLEKCRELDDTDRGIRRRIANCESQLSLADTFYTAGNYPTAKEAYEVVIEGCEKALKAGEAAVEAAKASLRSQYLEAERAEMKRMPMPNKDEIETSDMLVKAAIKDGADAGDLLSKAEYAEFASERYAFLLGAFRQGVKDKDGAIAGDAARALMDGFEKNDYAAIVTLIETEAKELIKEENEELGTVLKLAKIRVSADELRKEARKTLKKNPDDNDTRQRVAEALVILGEWETARKQFEKLKGGYSAAFADEADEEKLFAAAEFWWNCEQKGELNVKPFYRNRAISLYKRMLGKNKGSEEEQAIAEKRLAGRLLGK